MFQLGKVLAKEDLNKLHYVTDRIYYEPKNRLWYGVFPTYLHEQGIDGTFYEVLAVSKSLTTLHVR